MGIKARYRRWVPSKYDHLFSFLVVFVVAIGCFVYDQDLSDGASKTLGSIGGFLTIYAVIFAFIELVRTRSAAELAEQKVSEVVSVVEDLMTAREITECQIAVESALDGISRNEDITARYVVKIIRLYTQVFPVAMKDAKSEHRKNRSILQSYQYVERAPEHAPVPTKTQRALMSISGHLAEQQGETKRGKEKSE